MAKPSGNYWVRTGPILQAIQDRLEALKWAAPGGADVRAFEAVFSFDVEDLEQADMDNTGLPDRFAMIVFGGDRFEGQGTGQQSSLAVHRTFVILLSDRSTGDRQIAMRGGRTNPGALLLCDLTAEVLHGPLPVPRAEAAKGAPSRAWARPIGTSPATIKRNGKDAFPGRAVMALHVEVHCGDARVDLTEGRA